MGVQYDLQAALCGFGLREFRAGQREVMEAVLGGRDTVCVMPTGAGKSLCYQLPATLLKGPTLVVSPLIALMQDQVQQLIKRRIGAACVNSAIPFEEQCQILGRLNDPAFRLLYVAPERFRSRLFLQALKSTKVALFVVDEAHCISEWGHDFRPDYLRLAQARAALGNPVTIALTATATPEVQDDIQLQLNLKDPAVFVSGFDRPNLHWTVTETPSVDRKLDVLRKLLSGSPGSTIVYAATRRAVEEVAGFVMHVLRLPCVQYHGGMENPDRIDAQNRFMSGQVPIVVATNAFGMGVDKPDIRQVIHYQIPGTIEAYYQEAGRAGRDGLDAHAHLLLDYDDRRIQEFFIDNGHPEPEQIFELYDELKAIETELIEMSTEDLKAAVGWEGGVGGLRAALHLMERAEIIERLTGSQNLAQMAFTTDRTDDEILTQIPQRAQQQLRVAKALLAVAQGLRHESVHFDPRRVTAQLEVSLQQWATTVRNLRHTLPFLDYVPPFRGHAVRVLKRGLSRRDLMQLIDFERLTEIRDHEEAKLEQMFNWAEAAGCRRNIILAYFGEKTKGTCGRCDNCRRTGSKIGAKRLLTDEQTTIVRKILAGVARCAPSGGRPGFGRGMIADMLAGSKSQKIAKTRLMKLSTYGILKGTTAKDIENLIDQLVAAGCIRHEAVEGDSYMKVLVLTPRGTRIMKNDQRAGLQISFPKLPQPVCTAKPRKTAEVGGDEEAVFHRLRDVRKRIAEQRKIPPYVVAHDAVLRAIACRKPESLAQLREIPGIGPAKEREFGQAFLDALR